MSSEHAALRNEQNGLPIFCREASAECHVFDGVYEFCTAALLKDRELPVRDPNLQSSCRKGAYEDQLAGILGNVNESSSAGEAAAEQADIDVTCLSA